MKIFFIPLLLIVHSSSLVAQGVSTCNDETIMAVKGNWKRIEDVNHTPGNAAKASRIDAISKLFLQAYPNPMGIEAFWYRTYTTRLFTNGGPDAYSFYSLYKSWYCNKNINKLFLGEETGTWAYVFVNYFSWFMSNQYDKLDFTVGGRNVYRLPKIKGEWKGYPLYQLSSHHLGTFNCALILRPGNELPWRPITQRQYLDERRKILVAQRQTSRNFARKTDSSYNKSIENVRKNTFMKEADKARNIENLQKARDYNLSKIIADSARQIQYWQKKIDLIDNYIAKNDAITLQQPAVTRNTAEFTGAFEPVTQGGIELVTANPNYFKKNLAPEVPQMMILYWRWEKGPAAQDFKRQLETNFPIEKLQAMIDK
jgi:hypothetical protein